jgi:hypothetical protein
MSCRGRCGVLSFGLLAFMAAINWPNVARAYGELRP